VPKEGKVGTGEDQKMESGTVLARHVSAINLAFLLPPNREI
jgi:hypothetical protein